jgi:hypothetical protein
MTIISQTSIIEVGSETTEHKLSTSSRQSFQKRFMI